LEWCSKEKMTMIEKAYKLLAISSIYSMKKQYGNQVKLLFMESCTISIN